MRRAPPRGSAGSSSDAGQPAQPGDRLADLLEVGRAARRRSPRCALGLDPRRLGELALDQVGHQLDELAAGDLVHGFVVIAPASASKWRSSAALTFERARCRSTRWLVSLSSSALQASSAE